MPFSHFHISTLASFDTKMYSSIPKVVLDALCRMDPELVRFESTDSLKDSWETKLGPFSQGKQGD